MPQVPIIMPQLGESMAEATIVSIKIKPGDQSFRRQEIIEVETDSRHGGDERCARIAKSMRK